MRYLIALMLVITISSCELFESCWDCNRVMIDGVVSEYCIEVDCVEPEQNIIYE